jgi:hypothetical protein
MTSTSTYAGEEIDQTSFDLELIQPPAPAPKPVVNDIECLCPFCGTLNLGLGKPCANCKQEDTIARRDAAARKTGQWHVLQPGNTDSQGMTFDQLIAMIRDQSVTSRSIIRGAPTGQLWRLASKVRGLSREFGQCYSCGGDIETDETICPHCDRSQIVAEHSDAVPKPATESESPRQVRQALLTPEPVIHVHSLAHPEHPSVEIVSPARPVVAEINERHIPKDDLLTPRDLAKAFQLEFGPDREELNRFLAPPKHTARRLKIAFTSAGALALAGVMLWPLTHIVSGWVNDNTAKAVATVPSVSASVVTKPTAIAYTPREQIAPPTISYTPAPSPMTAGAKIAPSYQPEPTPAPSSEDDPKLLLSNAMDAESTRNYAAAVQAYERIESLPSDSWPANLEVRLALARKELKGDVR